MNANANVTEQEWRACIDPEKMLIFLRGHICHRKLRLVACACCRRIGHLLDGRIQSVIDLSEQHLDGLAVQSAIVAAFREEVFLQVAPSTAQHIAVSIVKGILGGGAWALAWNTVSEVRRAIRMESPQADVYEEGQFQSAVIRDIFGNPLRPVTVNPTWGLWHDGTVRRIAQAIYDERTFDYLPILADALEDAGCDNDNILNHCRSAGPHFKGCWVVDLLLGKE